MSSIAKTSESTDPKFWYNLGVENFIIQGKSKRTAETYSRELSILTRHYNKPLNILTEDEIREYVVYRRIECGLCATSMRILFCGFKFLFRDILGIDYPIFEQMRAQSESRLPKVLTRVDVITILNHISTFHNYAYLRTVYSCGLRLSEALNLSVNDIDGARKLLKIRGKGNKDRYVPLPDSTYELLQLYWKTHRNKRLIFPALGRSFKKAPISTNPMSISSVQSAIKRAARAAGINPTGIRVHTFRHSYATHLLESGVTIRAVQKYLGHANLNSTMIYLHLTDLGQTDSVKIINSVMGRTPLLMPFNLDECFSPNGEKAKKHLLFQKGGK